MDFIRNHWSRLSIALLFLLAGILGIIAFANSNPFEIADNAATTFYYIVLLISILVYFFGMVCIMILKACAGKKAVSIAYMVVGGIIAIMNLIALAVCNNYPELISVAGINALDVFFRYIVVTIVFGFYPLLKGITRFIEAEHTPKAAPKEVAAAAPAAKKPAKTAAK